MDGIKIRCANRYWARAVQIMLRDTIGATWGAQDCEIPWSTFRLWLVVRWSPHLCRWFFAWVPEREFDAVPHPEWDAQTLISARPDSPGWVVQQMWESVFYVNRRSAPDSVVWVRRPDRRIRFWYTRERAQATADRLNRKGIQ